MMSETIPKEKQTALGLYVTSAEAYEKWQAAPDEVKLLDVRTPEEFIFVGHPEMAQCIPLGFQSYRWDEQKGHFDLDVNPQFVDQVRECFDPDEILREFAVSGLSGTELYADVAGSELDPEAAEFAVVAAKP